MGVHADVRELIERYGVDEVASAVLVEGRRSRLDPAQLALSVTDDRPGKVGADHPDTSRRAARSVSNRARFGTQRFKVLAALAGHPMTAAEVAAAIGVSRNQTATRIGECHEVGWVEYLSAPSGEVVTRSTSADARGRVHRLTPAGHAEFVAAREREARRSHNGR